MNPQYGGPGFGPVPQLDPRGWYCAVGRWTTAPSVSDRPGLRSVVMPQRAGGPPQDYTGQFAVLPYQSQPNGPESQQVPTHLPLRLRYNPELWLMKLMTYLRN